ncbi:MAG: hypothetical protein R3F43_17765 [bacterium]
MFYLLTFLAVIPSPVLMFINGEAWAVFVGLMGTRDWMLLALAIACGQTVGFTLLYFFGGKALGRIPRCSARWIASTRRSSRRAPLAPEPGRPHRPAAPQRHVRHQPAGGPAVSPDLRHHHPGSRGPLHGARGHAGLLRPVHRHELDS